MQHNIETVTRKLKMNSTVHPPEVLMLLKDLYTKVEKLEKRLADAETRAEEPKPTRQKSNNISKRKISTDSISSGPND